MKIKLLPVLFSTLACMSAAPSAAYQQEDIYKVNDLIWIKNLFIKDGGNLNKSDGIIKVITFDIVFHSTSISQRIFARYKATDNQVVNPPNFLPDWRQGNQYQHVEIDLDNYFVSYIQDSDILRVTYGDLVLFQFECPKRLQPLNSYTYNSLEKLPKNMVFTHTIKLPYIKNGRIENYFVEVIDLTYVDFKKIQEYYYGKFPHEFIWMKFDTSLYNKKMTINELYDKKCRYTLSGAVFFYESELFKDYYDPKSNITDTPYWDSIGPIEEVNDYYNIGFYNLFDKVTFQDGRMRKKSELNDYVLTNYPNKPSKFLTFPLNPEYFEKNFELAKNMEIAIDLRAGIFENFNLSVHFNLNLKKDYFYNHLNESIVSATHDNESLDTVDIYYA